MNRERRVSARKSPAELGFIQIGQDDGGRILNISEGGLSFETFAPIEQDRLVQFWFSLDLRERIEGSGRLTWMEEGRTVGGLEFLQLSAKARRHLRTNLGAEPILYARGTSKDEGAGAVKRSPFLAALSKPPLRGLVIERPRPEGTAAGTVSLLAEDFQRNIASEAPKKTVPTEAVLPSWNPTAFVALERHRMDGRRQLLRGMALGSLLSLAVGAGGGWYLGRRQAKSGVAPRVVPAAAARPGERDLPADSSVGEPSGTTGTAGARSPVGVAPANTPREGSSTRSSDGGPRSVAAKSPTAFPEGVERAREGAAGPPQEAETKGEKKSPRTLKQLWAAAQAGNANALVELADHYIQGDGVPVNCNQARVLLLVASEKKNANAIKKLHDLDQAGSCPAK